MSNPICEYGCGKEAKYQFKNGKWCCKPHRNSCPAMIEKNKKGQEKADFKWSPEKRKEMRVNRKGEKNPMYGKHHSLLTKQKIRAKKKGRTYEEMYR